MRVPGRWPGECGLVRNRFSLCMQQLNWCAVDELSPLSYVKSTGAVGRVVLLILYNTSWASQGAEIAFAWIRPAQFYVF